ncbi:MAG TPA: hypothetical protein VK604_27280 [Bryobacteraceae bacterium]|nr:hypothetical protein [Bryobacteraceae bacterium]
MSSKNIGSSFDDFLKEEGIFEEVDAIANARVIAWQITAAMREQHISKNKMAKLMHTSRTQVDRLLNPQKPSIQLDTLQRAAAVVGRRLVVELKPAKHAV